MRNNIFECTTTILNSSTKFDIISELWRDNDYTYHDDDEEILQIISPPLPPQPRKLLTGARGLGLQVSFEIYIGFIYFFLIVNIFSDLTLENNYVGAVKNAFAKTKVKIR